MPTEQGRRSSMQDVETTMQQLVQSDDILRAQPWEMEKILAPHHPVFANFVVLTIPPGPAPEEVRKEWIGLELPIRSESDKGVPVVAAEAMERLRKNGRDLAAGWWYKYFEGHGHEIFWLRALVNPLTMVRRDCMANIAHLVFDKSCGEYKLIDENN